MSKYQQIFKNREKICNKNQKILPKYIDRQNRPYKWLDFNA